MQKSEAIKLLGGGNMSEAARAVGVSPQAVKQWPDPLTRKIEDRILAALYRREHGLLQTDPAPG